MIKKKVLIIDYKLGNLYSVRQACDVTGLNWSISSNPSDIKDADAIIFPGVGAFGEAMSKLKELEMIDPIKESISEGKPFFGICLGMQLLFEGSEEFGASEGLGILPGTVKRFDFKDAETKVKVPQIGWNRILHFQKDYKGTPLDNLSDEDYMYFVHSYFVEPDFPDHILTMTNYAGFDFCSSVLSRNIFATQFHPEKSAHQGLEIYKNWATINQL